jgi:hypothetical protein
MPQHGWHHCSMIVLWAALPQSEFVSMLCREMVHKDLNDCGDILSDNYCDIVYIVYNYFNTSPCLSLSLHGPSWGFYTCSL